MDSRLPIIDTILDRVVGVLGNICANTYELKLFTAAYTLFFMPFLGYSVDQGQWFSFSTRH